MKLADRIIHKKDHKKTGGVEFSPEEMEMIEKMYSDPIDFQTAESEGAENVIQ